MKTIRPRVVIVVLCAVAIAGTSMVGLGDSRAPALALKPSAAPVAPVPIAPEDGALLNARTVDFKWTPSTSDDVVAYTLQVSSGDAFDGPLVVESEVAYPGTGDSVTLQGDGAYLWRVLAGDSSGDETTSDALVFEIDTLLPPPTGTTPSDDPNGEAPISISDPFFIEIRWWSERDEYVGDSHSTVDLTKAVLDEGTGAERDVFNLRSSRDGRRWTIAIPDISLGDHTLTFNGVDRAGNSRDPDEVIRFTDVLRPDFELALTPGLNLVSLPGDPADEDINAVFAGAEGVNGVVTYDPEAVDPEAADRIRAADVDGSNCVDGRDLTVIARAIGDSVALGMIIDIDANRLIDVHDLVAAARYFGVGVPREFPTPPVFPDDPVCSPPSAPWPGAVRTGDPDMLEGPLTTMDARHAYWVRSTASVVVGVDIPPLGAQEPLPTIDVTGGMWNLVPVISLLPLEKIPQGSTLDADDYLGGNWTRGYTFDRGQWVRVVPGATVVHQCDNPDQDPLPTVGDCGTQDPAHSGQFFTRDIAGQVDDAVNIGRGYWVWFTADGTLTP